MVRLSKFILFPIVANVVTDKVAYASTTVKEISKINKN